jgi:hypothetical protein
VVLFIQCQVPHVICSCAWSDMVLLQSSACPASLAWLTVLLCWCVLSTMQLPSQLPGASEAVLTVLLCCAELCCAVHQWDYPASCKSVWGGDASPSQGTPGPCHICRQ